MKTQKATGLKRSLNTANHNQILISVNEKQGELINRLLSTGYWGSTPSEVVRRLIDLQLQAQATAFASNGTTK